MLPTDPSAAIASASTAIAGKSTGRRPMRSEMPPKAKRTAIAASEYERKNGATRSMPDDVDEGRYERDDGAEAHAARDHRRGGEPQHRLAAKRSSRPRRACARVCDARGARTARLSTTEPSRACRRSAKSAEKPKRRAITSPSAGAIACVRSVEMPKSPRARPRIGERRQLGGERRRGHERRGERHALDDPQQVQRRARARHQRDTRTTPPP